MTKLAVACMRRRQARFFAGRYDLTDAGIPVPVTTSRPDLASTYDDKAVAQFVVDLLNVFDGVVARQSVRHWIVMPLPEQWQ